MGESACLLRCQVPCSPECSTWFFVGQQGNHPLHRRRHRHPPRRPPCTKASNFYIRKTYMRPIFSARRRLSYPFNQHYVFPVPTCQFSDILEKVQDSYGGLPEKDGVFYDLGCGTGKPVFAAAAVHPWHRCIGMEILGDLHGICLKALERWEGGLRHKVTVGETKGGTAEIEFVCGDFTVLDWSDGDVVFANSTCFGDDLMKELAQGAAALKEGAIVVTMTDPVPSPAFEVLEETVMNQAGRCATTCYIQRRVAKPPPSFGPV
ncbi:unnamed protein product [Ectocarpus sp. 12 AP-2014]